MTDEPARGRGQILKVVELGLDDKVLEAMKRPDFSAEGVAREFNAEGIKITAQSIRKFVKKSKKAQQEIISKDLSSATQIKELVNDFDKTLRGILEEINEVKKTVKDDKDYASYNQMVGRLLQGIELFAKLTGHLKPKGSVDIKIIYNEISSDIEKTRQSLNKELFKGNTIDVDADIDDDDLQCAEELNN